MYNSRKQAVNDLADLYYEQGLFSGRWEDEGNREDCVKDYVISMEEFADDWDVKYPHQLSEYQDDEDEFEYETQEHMGYHIFCETEKKLRNVIGDGLIRTNNEISSPNPYEQEIASLEAILKSYDEERYNNVFVLVMNYLGHINHYCGHEGLVYRMLNNLTFSLEKKAKGKLTVDNDGFRTFVLGRLHHAKEGL